MALQYPLLFPYGETSYHEQIAYHNNTGRRQTNRAVEEQRLKWVRAHQNDLRIDLYNNICDTVTRGDTRASSIGKRIVLPSSHIDSPRYMIQNYQDDMALCREYDNPDLFITFTSNPRWPEIDGMLYYIEGQKAPDRPDIVARVFKQKLDELMRDIMKAHIFGKCQAGIYIIEFQKRGLPHVHMRIWLTHEYKCKSPSDIDELISAEIPSQIEDPAGYKVVTEYMLHGPCGGNNMDTPCIIDRKCSKHFPKPYYADTTIAEDGYANYRCRNNGIKVIKGKATLDNSFVVPYSRYLLLKYNAHINVEWCNRSRAIKYLFKYLNKGPDRATIVIQENLTRTGESSVETIIEMFSFDIHFSQPSVLKLSYHLPNHHTFTLHDSESIPTLLHREDTQWLSTIVIKEMMFNQWFELNKRDPNAQKLTYAKIPIHYVSNQTTKTWEPRKQWSCIGRIVITRP
ncbi:uncharacterized protein [Rutidosis leptorrhynchoides]|uniref:uncharacterized protein n=1 Tax=Rutidosis leptorrhynchoides TaxID=125765 RepID=UPI003A9A0255